MKKTLSLLLILVSFGFAGNTTEKIATLAYRATPTPGNYEFQVSLVAAQFSDSKDYLPLVLMVANKQGKSIMVTPDMFTLKDSDGNSWKPINITEFRTNNKQQARKDRKRISTLISGLIIKNYLHRQPSSFYPITGIKLNEIHVQSNHYMEDMLYFPRPKDNQLTLEFTSDRFPEAVTLEFTIPQR